MGNCFKQTEHSGRVTATVFVDHIGGTAHVRVAFMGHEMQFRQIPYAHVCTADLALAWLQRPIGAFASYVGYLEYGYEHGHLERYAA